MSPSPSSPNKLSSLLSPPSSHASSNKLFSAGHFSSPAPSESSSAAKLKLSNIAAKLITGVQSASPDVARDRWSNTHDPSVPRPSSNCRPKQASIPVSMPPPDSSTRKSVTASAFAAAKQERATARRPFPPSVPLHQRSPSVPATRVCLRDEPTHDFEDDSPGYRQRLPPQPQFQPRSPFDPVSHPNLHHIDQRSSSRPKSKSSAPPIFSTTETDLPYALGKPERSDRNLISNPEAKLKPPASSRFSRFKPTPNDAFVAVAYTATNPGGSSSISESDAEPATFEVAQRTHLPPSPSKHAPAAAARRSEHSAMRAAYLAKGEAEAFGARVETEKERVAREFEQLMTAMELPTAVRIKMGGLDHPVKAAMLRASTSSQLASHSLLAQALQLSTSKAPGEPAVCAPRSLLGVSQVSRIGPNEVREDGGRSGSERDGPAWWAMQLKAHNFRELEPTELRRLRVALRTQAPTWTAEFVSYGGFGAMMKRLRELLDIEWREEQHDDQVLYEILRCFKALFLSEPGKVALASRLPSPFIQLTGLLYSEKKPGDLPSRQLLIELIQGIFELGPIDGSVELDWTASISLEDVKSTGCGHASGAQALVRRLLLGPPDLKREQIVEFVSQTHRSRPYKKLVTELTGVLMDYFWVFCHAENQFWELSELDEEKIESPKVPSGMTGGVEYEAMGYCAAVMRLINEMIRTAPSKQEKIQIHIHLFESGFERCLVTLRKSSTTYYPGVHLELARYLGEAVRVDGIEGFKLSMNVMRHLRKTSNLLNC